MRRSQIEQLLESKSLSFQEVAVMPSRTRVSLGLPAVIPQTDYSKLQLFADSLIPKFSGLRRMFGLDQEIITDPVYHIGDDGGKASQFYHNSIQFNQQRGPIYTLAEEMNTYDMLHSILDLYAEEATQQDPDTQKVVWIESEDGGLQADLMDLMTRLGIDDRAFPMIRTMCMYGDNFERIITADNVGVMGLSFVHPARLSRIEDKEGRLQGFAAGILAPEECVWEHIKDKTKVSYPWDFLHFRLQSTNRDSKHGDSILLGSRRAYQQLKMMEDMAVLQRINRGMDRDVYYVNTNGSTYTEGWRTINNFRQEVRKKLAISPSSSMRQEYNSRTPDEDIFLPVNGKEDPTRVERQTGGSAQGPMDDIDHFRRKLLGSVRVPAGFVGFESDLSARATLASQDVRFARAIKRIQRAFKQGIRWLCEIHLIKKGVDTRDELGRFLPKYSIRMAPINQLEEQAKTELYQAKMQLVTSMLTLVGLQQQADPSTGLILPGSGIIPNVEAWAAWVMRKFLGLTDNEIGLFFGDPTFGLTADTIEMRKLTEMADAGGLIKRMQNSRHLIEAAKDLQDDESFELFEKKAERDGKFLLEDQEQGLRERLGHDGRGPTMQCPACREGALSVKYDQAEKSSYMLCPKCGYHGYLTEDVACEA